MPMRYDENVCVCVCVRVMRALFICDSFFLKQINNN